MTIFAFGDDHARAVFARCANITLHWLGPYTMNRLGHGGAFEALRIAQPLSGDTMIFMVGAEDVRRHLVRRAIEDARTVSDLIQDLATLCVDKVQTYTTLLDLPLRGCIVGVVPPAGPMWDAPGLPAIGAFQDRRVARELLNAALAARCRERGVAFVPIPKRYETKSGALNPRFSDGCGRIAADHVQHLCTAVEEAVGADLGHRRTGALASIRLRFAREWAVRTGDVAALADPERGGRDSKS